MNQDRSAKRKRLLELAQLFLKLGTVAFGGPAAHIAMMEEEVVRRRAWLKREEFLDLLGATNLIPGPNSTELAIHIGHRRSGWSGLLTAGVCFILPATLIVLFFAWTYVRFGKLPEVEAILYSIKPVIIAVIAHALIALARTAIKNGMLAALGIVILVLTFAGLNELVLLFAAGILTGLIAMIRNRSGTIPSFLPVLAVPAAAAGAAIPYSLNSLFLFFLKVGSILFGSGYVLLVFLRADLVERWRWLTEAQLLDAIAVGQFTPGPVFTTATFIGYLLDGTTGAFVATAGIFLPAFVFVAISGPLVPRLRASQTAGAFLDGINVASLALMAAVSVRLAFVSLIDPLTILIAAASVFLMIRFKVNSAWLVAGGAVIGIIKLLLLR